MKYSDIIVEVKTKWMVENDIYYRNVIEYKIDCDDTTPSEIAPRFINEYNVTKEISATPIVSEIEVNLKNNKNEIITKTDNFLESILNYTKYQWGVNN